jgi:hypothetical protein
MRGAIRAALVVQSFGRTKPQKCKTRWKGGLRRRAKAREQAAQAHAAAVLHRRQWQVAKLRTHLDRLAARLANFC